MKAWLLLAFCNYCAIAARVTSSGTYGWAKICLKVVKQNGGSCTCLHIPAINASSALMSHKEV